MIENTAFENFRSTDREATPGTAASLEANNYQDTKFTQNKQSEPDFITFTTLSLENNSFNKPPSALRSDSANNRTNVTPSATDKPGANPQQPADVTPINPRSAEGETAQKAPSPAEQEQKSDKVDETAKEEEPKVYSDPDGEFVDTTYPDGRQERVLKDGTKITSERAADGGRISITEKDGKVVSTTHASMQKDGSVVHQYISAKPDASFEAIHGKDGTMTVDWADGRHMIRREKDGLTFTEMTGPDKQDNFKSTEFSNGDIHADYADGSTWDWKREGNQDARTDGGNEKPASQFSTSTFYQLYAAYWMTMNDSVAAAREDNEQ